MAACISCGKKIGFMNSYDGKCIDCYSHQEGENKTPAQRPHSTHGILTPNEVYDSKTEPMRLAA